MMKTDSIFQSHQGGHDVDQSAQHDIINLQAKVKVSPGQEGGII